VNWFDWDCQFQPTLDSIALIVESESYRLSWRSLKAMIIIGKGIHRGQRWLRFETMILFSMMTIMLNAGRRFRRSWAYSCLTHSLVGWYHDQFVYHPQIERSISSRNTFAFSMFPKPYDHYFGANVETSMNPSLPRGRLTWQTYLSRLVRPTDRSGNPPGLSWDFKYLSRVFS
jgi:hypothetical protein